MGGHAKGLLQETAIRHRAVPFVRNLSESKKGIGRIKCGMFGSNAIR